MLRPRNPMRRLSLPAVLGTILFGASVLAVSAQTVGNDAGTGQSAVTNQEAADHNDNGPPWERDDPCSPDAGDPDGRGGPPWVCGDDGVETLDAGSGITKGPAWLRATHPGRGHGPGGDAD